MGRHKTLTGDYAMYRGDKFIDLGTLDELSSKYHKPRERLRYLSVKSVHERYKNGEALLLYKIKG